MLFSTRALTASCATLALAAALAAPAHADEMITVTSASDSGAGSLRAALAQAAQSDATTRIVLSHAGPIALESTLDYEGTAPLVIVGSGQDITMAGNATLLKIGAGADLDLSGVTLSGPGGYSIKARGDKTGAPGKGIFVDLRDDQTGVVRLSLRDVTVQGVAGKGVHVSDCTLAEQCGSGGGGAGEGSAAGIEVYLENVMVRDLGFGAFDADGVRVDERGPGDIRFTAINSTFTNVGADGVELDEGQDGNVWTDVTGTHFDTNGGYCDPAVLAAFMPEMPEGEFEAGAMQEANIPGPVKGSPDDACFEREVSTYDDGSVEAYEFGLDLDDGFDIDEAGAGSIRASVTRSTVIGNLDEGLDFDEEDAGDIVLNVSKVETRDNTDDSIKMSEAGAGGVSAVLSDATLEQNGGTGATFEQEDEGDVEVAILGGKSMGNDDGGTGIKVAQDGDGAGVLIVSGAQISDEIKTHGVTLSRDGL
ncbi:hypothetical protein DL1_01255 [Thioclava dalianensis]|uniref:Right handed beta helix domain-containing protein n=1 Tax=Thioclava dalianensis TaxID=1185766 RepID=A0A074TNQ8_9RHOB|nr:hypothetical protein [Thioclava dalianensis]KEP71780.1 hypothetical protein DL1_01255 [Thioclava dalianensis]SFN41722.1 hypothetical protein SAMN05216224_105135 [Thioclava dalianensis]